LNIRATGFAGQPSAKPEGVKFISTHKEKPPGGLKAGGLLMWRMFQPAKVTVTMSLGWPICSSASKPNA
jgi:hypothetical protein